MSYVPGNTSEDPRIHFKSGMEDVFRLDKVRFINIIGTIQYGLLYVIIYFMIGISLHYIFPSLNKNDTLTSIFLWIILQSIIIILITFYVQKFIEAIPGIISFFPQYFNLSDLLAKGFIPYGVSEYKGNMASSIILIGTQMKLLEKVAYFTTEFTKRYL
jgi:hypothetical protein